MLIYTNLFSDQTLKKSPIPYAGDLEAGRGDYWPTLLKHFSQFRVHFSNQRLKTLSYLSVIQLSASSIEQAAGQRAGGDWERLGGGRERLGGGGLTHIVGVRSCTTTRTNRSCKMWKAFTPQDITDSSPGKTQSVVRRRWQLAELCSSSLQ